MRGNTEPICFGECGDNALPKDILYLPPRCAIQIGKIYWLITITAREWAGCLQIQEKILVNSVSMGDSSIYLNSFESDKFLKKSSLDFLKGYYDMVEWL